MFWSEQENILLKWEMARLKADTAKLRTLLLEDEANNQTDENSVNPPDEISDNPPDETSVNPPDETSSIDEDHKLVISENYSI